MYIIPNDFIRDCMHKFLPVEMIWSFGGHLNLFATIATFSRRKGFFLVSVGKGLAVFLYCFHTSILIGSPVWASWSDTTALYPLLLPLWQLSSLLMKSSLWYPEWWNVHSPHKKDCLHIQMTLWDPWYRTNLLEAGFRPWYLWEQDLGAKCLP